MEDRRVLNADRCEFLSSLGFAYNNNVCHFHQAQLGKRTDIFQKNRGMLVSENEKPESP
jgi:hypothetical protein